MRVGDVLTAERIWLASPAATLRNKDAVLSKLAELLAPSVQLPVDAVFRPLAERERLQSTGIGEGVAIPHASVQGVTRQVAALVLSQEGFEFEAIDQHPVHLVFGVLAPRQPAGEHPKLLARISRLLRTEENRQAILEASSATAALAVIQERDQ